MLDQIMEKLTPRRMMSVGNLALLLEIEPEELHPCLQDLEADGRVRYALSKCAGSCSTCSSGCGSDGAEEETQTVAVDPTAIVISMELRQTDD